MRRFLGKYRKPFRHGEKGFTLIELLIVVAVLGALAAVVVPSVAAFLGTANLTAANTEAANVKTGAMSYLADNGAFPATSAALFGGATDYVSQAPDAVYTFDATSGQVTGAVAGAGITNGLTFCTAGAKNQQWVKGACP